MIKAILVICNRKSRRETVKMSGKGKRKEFMSKSPVLRSSFRNGTIAAGQCCLNGFIMAEDNRTHGEEKRKQRRNEELPSTAWPRCSKRKKKKTFLIVPVT